MTRTYQNAIEILNQRRRPVRPTSKPPASSSSLNHMPNINGRSDMRGTPSIFGMSQWLCKLGYSASDIDNMNIIHVAGTKGKGSTCAFIDTFLQQYSERTGLPRKRGLYTSPHLLYPEERIRINAEPLEKDLFAKYFFEVLDALLKHEADAPERQPRFLQLFFLVAIHTFIRERVDVAIIETHHGGEYDATNVIRKPIVTAITSLGLDHVSQLGPSIENIAWHKSGIFKAGATAFSVEEEQHVKKVLQDRSSAKAVDLTFVNIDPCLPEKEVKLTPEVQRLNSSLALAVVRSFIAQKYPYGPEILSEDIVAAVRQFKWPGRFQTIVCDKERWYLDGAHNEMSAVIAAKWFIEASTRDSSNPGSRVLIFGQISEQRDPLTVLQRLAQTVQPDDIELAIFTSYDPTSALENSPSSYPCSDPRFLNEMSAVWSARHPGTHILTAANVNEALMLAKAQRSGLNDVHIFVTGSQYLVGAALISLNSKTAKTPIREP